MVAIFFVGSRNLLYGSLRELIMSDYKQNLIALAEDAKRAAEEKHRAMEEQARRDSETCAVKEPTLLDFMGALNSEVQQVREAFEYLQNKLTPVTKAIPIRGVEGSTEQDASQRSPLSELVITECRRLKVLSQEIASLATRIEL